MESYPGFSFLEPWAEISQRLRRIFNTESVRSVNRLLFSSLRFYPSKVAELNLYGMVDAQIPLVEGELLAGDAIS